MITTTPPLQTRARRLLTRTAGAVAIATGVVVGSVAIDVSPVSATNAIELPVNALAPEVTRWSSEALEALDEFETSGDSSAELRYEWYRSVAAFYTATQLGYSPSEMIGAWDETTADHQRAVLGALSQVGVPYRTNSSLEDEGFDCSGLTYYAWEGAGLELFRRSGDQISDARRLSRDDAKAGDLVHYPGHVMMYLGVDDAIVHSVNTGRTVEIDTISERRRNSVTFGDPTLSD
jgi:hypothetical protein